MVAGFNCLIKLHNLLKVEFLYISDKFLMHIISLYGRSVFADLLYTYSCMNLSEF